MGVNHAVMSPGSRNAPLTISFARNTHIQKWIIPDERAAGFVAIGIAQATKSPVVLCCTSGSALLNYAPAIAEAYYRELPIVILSADRPPELIDQRDGQTIRQYEALKNHVVGSHQTPVVDDPQSEREYQHVLVKALQQSMGTPKGPVHVNIPFREPFYPQDGQEMSFHPVEKSSEQANADESQIALPDVSSYQRVLILVGQQTPDNTLTQRLEAWSKHIPIINSPLNNLHVGIKHVDGFVEDQQELQPDLLITAGLSVLSKKLKTFIRKHTPKRHLHCDPHQVPVDTYDSHPELLPVTLDVLLDRLSLEQIDATYVTRWGEFSARTATSIARYIEEAPFSETSAVYHFLRSLPVAADLHLSNSMPVRYADLMGVPHGICTYGNRGTSGIDGCTSTVAGTAMVTENLQVLLTGDLAFLYDRNAFFHNYPLPNLRVVILNNQGGGIFRLIDGPSRLPELEPYFETRHNRTAEYICAENGLEYHPVNSLASMLECLESFYEASEEAKIMEVFTTPETNQMVYKELKKNIHERINN